MWKKFSLLLIAGGFLSPAFCQIQKHFTVESSDEANLVCLTLKATSGTCYINPTRNPHPVNVYGHPENEHTSPQLQQATANNEHRVNVHFASLSASSGFTSSMSRRMFGTGSATAGDHYKVFLSERSNFDLEMNYDVGDAYINLSGLSVEKCKINTGNADVQVSYMEASPNQVAMDTFLVKVDMGSLEIENMNLSRAKNVIADVGFGTLSLDFGVPKERSSVTATVGAGKLEVLLANETIPVMVHLNNSPLCHIKFGNDFREISDNVYVNAAYKENAPNLLVFDVEVAMGNLRFTYQE